MEASKLVREKLARAVYRTLHEFDDTKMFSFVGWLSTGA